jgi:hypothetical protein
MLGLIAELNYRRIARITGQMAKQGGGRLNLPKRVLEQLTTARRLHHRYVRGDYRHDDTEQGRIRDLCLWLLEQHRAMQGRPADATGFEWDGTKLHGRRPTPPGTSPQVVRAITDGALDDPAE